MMRLSKNIEHMKLQIGLPYSLSLSILMLFCKQKFHCEALFLLYDTKIKLLQSHNNIVYYLVYEM